jgi:hypothetical protein
LVRHQDKQHDRVRRIPGNGASRRQVKCAEAKSESAKSKASVGFAHRGFAVFDQVRMFLSMHLGETDLSDDLVFSE